MYIDLESPILESLYQKYKDRPFDEEIFLQECMMLLEKIREEQGLDEEKIRWAKAHSVIDHFSQLVISGLTERGIMTLKNKLSCWSLIPCRDEWLDFPQETYLSTCEFFLDSTTNPEVRSLYAHEWTLMESIGAIVSYYQHCCDKLCREIVKIQEQENMLLTKEQEAASGDIQAMLFLGQAYYEGWLCRRDVAKSFAYYKQAADMGAPEGLFGLARQYSLGDVVKPDAQKAIALYEEAAVKGNFNAMLIVGESYIAFDGQDEDDGLPAYLGNCVFQRPKDIDKAKYWYDKAIDVCKNNDEALAHCYNRVAASILRAGKNTELSAWAEECHLKAAAMGNVASMRALPHLNGFMARYEDTFFREYEGWLKKVERASGLKKIRTLGQQYIDGTFAVAAAQKRKSSPYTVKMKREINWLSRAATSDDAWAAFTMGNIYYYGYGKLNGVILKDAGDYYRKAAMSAKPIYAVELGDMYWYKQLKSDDGRSSAFNCYYQAAMMGNRVGLERLAGDKVTRSKRPRYSLDF